MWWEQCDMVEQTADNNVTRRVRIACWIPEATNAHSGRDNSVGIATRYELDGPRIETRFLGWG